MNGLNWHGVSAIYRFEMNRAFRTWMQSLIAPVLTTALQIHSVEARHAAAVRPLVGKSTSDGAFDEPKTMKQVLAAATPFLA